MQFIILIAHFKRRWLWIHKPHGMCCYFIDIPMWADKEIVQPLTVIRPLDVNADPALQVVHVSFISIFFCSSQLDYVNFEF